MSNERKGRSRCLTSVDYTLVQASPFFSDVLSRIFRTIGFNAVQVFLNDTPYVVLNQIKMWKSSHRWCLTTGPCEPTSWTRYPDTNVYDGAPHPPSTTIPSCQSACVANSSCTAIDWDDSSSDKCWHHGPWSAGNQMNSASGVQHYRLTRRYCDGKREMCI